MKTQIKQLNKTIKELKQHNKKVTSPNYADELIKEIKPKKIVYNF